MGQGGRIGIGARRALYRVLILAADQVSISEMKNQHKMLPVMENC